MRVPVALLSAVMVMSLAGASGASPGVRHHQDVRGSVAVRAPFPDAYSQSTSECYAGLHRRLAFFGGAAANGVFGFHFNVDPKTRGKRFRLRVTGGVRPVDLDIAFYSSLGDAEEATDPTRSPGSVVFARRGPGGEAGLVPLKVRKAIVCMWDGAGATFRYRAERVRPLRGR